MGWQSEGLHAEHCHLAARLSSQGHLGDAPHEEGLAAGGAPRICVEHPCFLREGE